MSYADKQLIPVQIKKNISVSNDPGTAQEFFVDFTADANDTLSDYYGKNIRQGNAFKLKRVDISLQPPPDGDFDTGLSVWAQGLYTPCTKHTRRAWNQLFEEWKKQKTLKGAVGTVVRYDDFELAWNDVHAATTFNTRASTMFAGGIGDADGAEQLTIQGASATGQFLSLKDYYERRNPIVPPSQTPFGGVVKDPKFDTYWPDNVEITCAGNISSVVTNVESSFPLPGSMGNALSGSNSSWTPWEGNANIFLGSMHWYVFVTPDDTPHQQEDSAELTMTFWIESWKPMVYKARKNRSRSNTRRFKRAYRGRKSYGKRRRSRRRY